MLLIEYNKTSKHHVMLLIEYNKTSKHYVMLLTEYNKTLCTVTYSIKQNSGGPASLASNPPNIYRQQVFLQELRFVSVIIALPMPHTHSFIYHRCRTNSATDDTIKQNNPPSLSLSSY